MTQETDCFLIKMEIANADEEPDPPLLTDSGTESFNDSPTADDSSTSAASTCHWELGSQQRIHIRVKSILDTSISIDEDILMLPLQPEVLSLHKMSDTNGNREPHLISILRRTSFYDTPLGDATIPEKHQRRVSFPEKQHLLASYRETYVSTPTLPEEPWDAERILAEYQTSCTRNKTIQLDTIKNQLLTFRNNINYSETFSMATVNITMEVCETIEDLFKIANFHTIIIKDCTFTPESVREFLNILDYYNSATEILTTDNYTQESEVWSSFCAMISKCNRLESLNLENFSFTDHHFRALLNGLKNHENIRILKFNCCRLSNSPTHYLVNFLETNIILQELYLPQTGLYTREAELLSRLLANNHHIKVLDISNNQIGDRGLEALERGLRTHTDPNNGLSVLVIYNTQISEKSAVALSNIISGCKSLHTLNIGCNNLTDEVISKIGESLIVTESFEGLGLQSTLLTDRGASLLADAVQNNRSLQKINLKGNKGIQIQGLANLCQALTNSKIIKLEIDETNRNCDNLEGYIAMVAQIHAICTVNKTRLETANGGDEEEINNWSLYFLRKISLNCEPIYNLPNIQLPEVTTSLSRKKSPMVSPMQSPGCSPTPRSRFSVSRVPESKPRGRFTVSPVNVREIGSGDALANSSPPDDDICANSSFSNIRSSVSSIESVDSISIKDSVYDSATPSGESD